MKTYTKIILAVLLVIGTFSYIHKVEAVTVSTQVTLPWKMMFSPEYFSGLGVPPAINTFFGAETPIVISLNKSFRFLKEDGSAAGQEMTLWRGKSITASVGDTTGNWKWVETRALGKEFMIGTSNDSNAHQNPERNGYITNKIFLPEDNNSVTLTSSNSSIVSCSGNTCTAQAPGTAWVAASFPKGNKSLHGQTNFTYYTYQGSGTDSVYNLGSKFYGNESAYGRIKAISYYYAGSGFDDHSGNQRTVTYDFPSVSYKITVPEPAVGENQSHTVACTSLTNVAMDALNLGSVSVNWSYSDPENDPQTVYHVEILDANGNIIKSERRTSNVSSTRSHAFTGLYSKATYTARVGAENATNGWSGWKNCAGSFTIPAIPAPTGPVGTCIENGTKARFAWNNASGYNDIYFRAQDQSESSNYSLWNNSVTGTEYILPITPGKSYAWWIHTRTSDGAWSDAVGGSITCSALLPPTSSCTVSNVKSRNATINWTYSDPNNDPQTGYYGIVSTNAGRLDDGYVVSRYGTPDWAYPSSDSNVPSTRSAIAWNLQPNTTYYPASAVYNTPDQWASGWKHCPAFTTLAGPPPPTGLNAACDPNNSKVTLTWTNASGYNNVYFRAVDRTLYPYTDNSNLFVENYVGNTYSISVTSDHAYDWWIHTRSSDGDYSARVDGNRITCQANSPKVLSFHPNGGTGSIASLSVLPNDSVALPAGTNFSREGYTFDSWNTQSNASGTKYTVGANYKMGSSDTTLWATWVTNQVSNPKLTVIKNGNGTGSVSSLPAGINCGNDCEQTYPSMTSVTLTATATGSSTFSGWSDSNCIDTGLTCRVTMSGDKTVTATFTADGTVVGGTTPTGSFYFNPTTAGAGGTCPAYLTVSGQSSCKLVNTRNSSTFVPLSIVDGIDGYAGVGTWKLKCFGTGDQLLVETDVGSARSCFSNPSVIED